MTVEEMEQALEDVGARLARQHLHADIVLAGGAWMALVLGARPVTKDIDAYLAPPADPVRRAALEVAAERSLPPDWLNDGIKGFFFRNPPQTLWREFGGLSVCAVSADYMLALKTRLARPTRKMSRCSSATWASRHLRPCSTSWSNTSPHGC